MSRFANLSDAGQRLAVTIADEIDRERAILLAVVPNGVPVAIELSDALGLELRALPIERSDAGVAVQLTPELTEIINGRIVVLVDDGVETGTVARAAASTLRAAGITEIVLAVPVCPREAMADLTHRYDRIIAVQTPMARRSLTWHFDDFDTIDDATAYAMLARRS